MKFFINELTPHRNKVFLYQEAMVLYKSSRALLAHSLHWFSQLYHFKPVLGSSLKFQKTVSLNSLKNFRIKEPLVPVISETLKN